MGNILSKIITFSYKGFLNRYKTPGMQNLKLNPSENTALSLLCNYLSPVEEPETDLKPNE